MGNALECVISVLKAHRAPVLSFRMSDLNRRLLSAKFHEPFLFYSHADTQIIRDIENCTSSTMLSALHTHFHPRFVSVLFTPPPHPHATPCPRKDPQMTASRHSFSSCLHSPNRSICPPHDAIYSLPSAPTEKCGSRFRAQGSSTRAEPKFGFVYFCGFEEAVEFSISFFVSID